MKQSIFTIKENIALTSSVYKMTLEGDVSDITNPGQFVNIKLDGFYLRRPISVCDCEKDELNEKEKYYISFFKSQEWGYNIMSGG